MTTLKTPKPQNLAPQQEVPLPETVVDTPKSPEIIPARPVREGRKSLDYRKLNNFFAQPTRHVPMQTAPQEVLRAMASPSPRWKTWEIAHLVHETLVEKLEQCNLVDLEWLPWSVEEALKSDERVDGLDTV